MKKLLCLVLCLLMVFSLTIVRAEDNASESKSDNTSQSSAPSSSKESDDSSQGSGGNSGGSGENAGGSGDNSGGSGDNSGGSGENSGGSGENSGGSGENSGGSGENSGGSGDNSGGSGENSGGSGGNSGGSGENSGGSGGNSGGSGENSGGSGNTDSHVHNYDITATVPATCKSEGAIAYGCSACGAIKTEILPKLTTHTYDNACDPTCNVCGATREVKHSVSSNWYKDGTYHWHACLTCGEKMDKKYHIPGPAATEEKDQICLTCGYILTYKKAHTHKLEEQWSSDKTGHWHACSNCEEKPDLEDHVYDNPCDPDCNVCGFVSDPTHSLDGNWNMDETGHWYLCASCGELCQYAAHELDKNGSCAICGFSAETTLPSDHEHIGEGSWRADATDHWKLCACGEKTDRASHDWKKDGKTYLCSVCGAEGVPAKDSQGGGVGIVLIALAVVLVLAIVAFVVLLIMLRKPKSHGKFSKSH